MDWVGAGPRGLGTKGLGLGLDNCTDNRPGIIDKLSRVTFNECPAYPRHPADGGSLLLVSVEHHRGGVVMRALRLSMNWDRSSKVSTYRGLLTQPHRGTEIIFR